METKAGDPGAFAQFDLGRVPSPAFVVDEAAVRRNLAILADIRTRSGAKVLLALKAFSMWSLAPLIDEYLDGYCASGLWEARLAREHFRGPISTYSPAYKAEDLARISAISEHVTFNNPAQIVRWKSYSNHNLLNDSSEIGLRINPQIPLGETEKYDPSQPHSRLGFPVSQLAPEHFRHLSGIHFHNLCEQGFDALQQTWEKVEPYIAPHFGTLKWINLGGGHHITRDDYDREALVFFLKDLKARSGCDIYLEPGEAVALDAGILVGEILDVFDNGIPVGITDISATCHMPDVIEAPYRPAMLGERSEGTAIRLGGPSCLAGDIIGDYILPADAHIGQRIAFLDQAHYSMVKTNTFNGVPLPSIWLWNSDNDTLKCVKTFDWTVFQDRLS
ncbi:carboxynorspermidine decarboxylase [Sphingorhabdus sp. 109]|jgi:carboxynorspermidine decarboxylase|uniref:carboxynorspermidine decarboxylase n=1 Tax=Sphingorhabdus sp. 109 TaxID=2653173 RepID=UPI0012F32A24|nr:carboxynorspermidine decarboxylase [Sphingorhabdus sp. 109]VWX57157.1 Carboxynorspermidine/carboxyspermidine decarboxylase [Sphingorhabdus sp. 109]